MSNITQLQFWDDEEGGLWDDLAELMLEIYLTGIDGGIAALPANIRVLADFGHVNTAALEFAKTYRYSWIKKITDTTREQTQKAVSDWIQSGAPLPALERALEPIYGSVRASMIAQTETTRIFQTANSEVWKSTGFVNEVKYQTVVDDAVCPVCGPGHDQIYTMDDYENLPPRHIRCRCYTLPVVNEEVVAGKLSEILE